MDFAENLNLPLAWRKTKRDYSHYMNSFISSPYIIQILENKKESWLDELRDALENEEFDPRSPRIIDVPKGDYHLRPASVLHPEDLVVCSALILEVFDELRSSIEWSAGECRYHTFSEKILMIVISGMNLRSLIGRRCRRKKLTLLKRVNMC